LAVHRCPVSFALQGHDSQEERLSIRVCGRKAGDAIVRYEAGTARVLATLDLKEVPGQTDRLEQFHLEFAEELMAYVLDRGAMAEGEDGYVTYRMGPAARAMPLPSHREVGLGFPNSW
jgi:hypothetical protein